MTKDLAIVGISVELPEANDIHGLWDIVRTGRSLTRPYPVDRQKVVTEFIKYNQATAVKEADGGYSFHNGCFLERERIFGFDHEFFGMTPKQAATTDPQQRLILRNMYRAVEDAGYVGARIKGTRTGVFVGFAGNPSETYQQFFTRADPSLAAIGLTGNIVTMLANRFSYLLDLRGPSLVVDTGCSASLVAVHLAKNALLSGDCDMAIVGGTRVVTPMKVTFNKIGIESSDGVTRTFDDRADGTGFGEGSGVVVLKRLDRALQDHDQIYAVIKGSAVNHDGTSEVMTSPDAESQARLLVAAWHDAGIDPATIGYLETHGTATRVGDPIEFEGLRRAFAQYTDKKQFCAVGSVKANVGHLYEGSGVLGLIKAALTVQRGAIPPLANFHKPNSRIDLANGPIYIPTAYEPWVADGGPRRCGVNSFGIGGTNCHVVVEEFRAPRRVGRPAAGPHLFTLSARSEASLRRLVAKYVDHIDRGLLDGAEIADICYTTRVSRSGYGHRLALVVDSLRDLRGRLAALAENRAADAADIYSTVESWSSGTAPAASAASAASYAERAGTGEVAGDECDRPYIIGLPSYEFDDRQHSIEFTDAWRHRLATPMAAAEVHPTTHEIGLEAAEPAIASDTPARILAVVDPGTDAERMLAGAELGELEFLRLGEQFEDDEAGFKRVAGLVSEQGYSHLVFALGFEADTATDVAVVDRRIRKNLYGLFGLSKALMAASARVSLVVLTRQAVAVDQGEPVVAENAAAGGFVRVIPREYPTIKTRHVDVDSAVSADALRREILCADQGLSVLRGADRFREVFRELPEVGPSEVDSYLKPAGTYLITGGTGGLGMEVCRSFAAMQPGINLVLLSRSGVPPREAWERIVTSGLDRRAVAQIQALREVEALGAQVQVCQVDVGVPEDLARVVAQIREGFGRVDGIVHAAGIPGKNLIPFRTLEDFESVVRPKVHAAFVLDQLTRHDRPDFIVYFSSVAVVFPAAGQSDYAAANYYLDNLARANPDDRCHVLAIDWVAWRDVGMAADYGTNVNTMVKPLPTEAGLAVLDAGLRSRRSRVFAGEMNYDDDLIKVFRTHDIALAPEIEAKIDRAVAVYQERQRSVAERTRQQIEAVEVELTGREGGSYSSFEKVIAQCWADAFGYPTIDVDGDFFDMGGDSIMAISLVENISTCLGTELEAVDLLLERTVAGVARRLAG